MGANRDSSAGNVGGSANRVGSNSCVVNVFAANQSVSKQSRSMVAAAPRKAAPANRTPGTQRFASQIAANISAPPIERVTHCARVMLFCFFERHASQTIAILDRPSIRSTSDIFCYFGR